jgi:hypothetical protein
MIDREYRQAVSLQCEAAESAQLWHDKVLPVSLPFTDVCIIFTRHRNEHQLIKV